jgi:anti-sigma factor RsiW
MPHIKEEQISAYVDRQLDAAECRSVEEHVRECETCSALLDEMCDLTHLFRDSERMEPSPFLWNRIAANINAHDSKERAFLHGWGAAVIAGLRRYAFNPGIAAAALGVLMFAGIAVFRQIAIPGADPVKLAEIDRAYQNLAAQDPDANNPFSSAALTDFDSNPFRSVRLSGRSNSAR